MRKLLLLAVVAACGSGDDAPTKASLIPPPVELPAAAVIAPDAGVAHANVVITSTSGAVEVRREAGWQPAGAAERLAKDDEVRTAVGGGAVIALPGSGEVVLDEDSAITVGDVTQTTARVRLDRGRIDAELDGNGAELEVGAAGSDAIAAAKTGRFRMFTDGVGLIAVATEAGEVKLSSKGADVVVGPGEGAIVRGDKATKAPIPRTVYLKVAWPDVNPRATEAVVRGQAAPGTRIEINKQRAEAGADGTFAVKVPLAEGRNRVALKAVDPFGRAKTEQRTIEVDRSAPRIEVEKPRWK